MSPSFELEAHPDGLVDGVLPSRNAQATKPVKTDERLASREAVECTPG